ILESMTTPDEVSSQDLANIVEEVCADTGFDGSRGWLFKNTVMYFTPRDDTQELPLQLLLAKNTALFGGAKVVTDLTNESITHIVADSKATNLSDLRKSISKRSRLKVPHLVSSSWIQKSWNEKTMLDEQSESSDYAGCRGPPAAS
ncbi:DNA ligase (ATP), partial [Ascosphaera atra]